MVCYGIGSTPGADGAGKVEWTKGGKPLIRQQQTKEGKPSLFGFGFKNNQVEITGNVTGTVTDGVPSNKQNPAQQVYDPLTGTYITTGHQVTETPGAAGEVSGVVTGNVTGTVTGEILEN